MVALSPLDYSENPDADIAGLRVLVGGGRLGTVVGRDIFGQRWRVRLDNEPRHYQSCIFEPWQCVVDPEP